MKRYVSAISILVLLASGLVFSCVEKRVYPVSLPDSPQDPALIHGVLPNGFQYLVMKNATPKERVNVHLNVFTGSAHEGDEEQGVAHFLEHMLFNGSEHFKPGELITYFQSIGMDFGADANARTSFFSTIYDLSLPKGDKKHLEDAFLVIRDYAGGALLLEEEVERERGVILAEKRERDSVSYRTFKKELAFEMPDSLLTERLPIGRTEVLEAADQKLLKGFYDQWYRPDNMALVVVGDVDTDLALSLIKANFSHLSDRSESRSGDPDISWTPHQGVKSFYLNEPEAGKTQITIERLDYVPFEPGSVDRMKTRAVQLIGDIILDNRLSRMVREQRGDFTSSAVYSGTYLKNMSIAMVQVSCEAGLWKPSLMQLENTLRQALEHGFLPQELEQVRSDYLTALKTDVAGASTRKSRALAQSILNALNQKELFLSPDQKLDILTPFIESLTLDQVNNAFKASWAADHRLVMVTGNARIDHEPENRILKVYQKAEAVPVSTYQGVTAKAFPYLELPEKKWEIINEIPDAHGLGINQVTYGNHIRLNLKSTDFKKGEFKFKAVFGNGKQSAPKALNGLTGIGQSTVRESGLGAMDMDQLKAALAGRDVNISFKVNETYLSLEGSAAPEEAELVFQLIHAHLNDPGFRDQGLDLAKNRYRQRYEALKRTPDGVMQIQGNRFLAGGDARFGFGHPDEADRITLDQVRHWLAPQFKSGSLEVSVTGDFNSKTIINIASTYMGSMDKRTPPEVGIVMEAPLNFPQGQTLSLDLDTKIDKGVVRVAFLTDDFWDIMQTRKLSVLSRVFSERLRKSVRETLGASYSPYVFNNPSTRYQGYGVMQAVVKTDPDSFDPVYDQVMKIALDLAENGVTQEELSLVLPPIMSHLTVLKQSNEYWLNSVMADSFRHPERLEWATHLEKGYNGITSGELSELAKKYLDTDKSTLIRIQPQ